MAGWAGALLADARRAAGGVHHLLLCGDASLRLGLRQRWEVEGSP